MDRELYIWVNRFCLHPSSPHVAAKSSSAFSSMYILQQLRHLFDT